MVHPRELDDPTVVQRRRRFCFVADAGLVTVLPLLLSARPKRNSNAAVRDWRHSSHFVGAGVWLVDHLVLETLD